MSKTAILFLLVKAHWEKNHLPEFHPRYIKARVFARVVGASRLLPVDSVSPLKLISINSRTEHKQKVSLTRQFKSITHAIEIFGRASSSCFKPCLPGA